MIEEDEMGFALSKMHLSSPAFKSRGEIPSKSTSKSASSAFSTAGTWSRDITVSKRTSKTTAGYLFTSGGRARGRNKLALGHKNRIGWARTYLTKAGLLEGTRRGYFKITDRGLDELRDHGDKIPAAYLKKFDEFMESQTAWQERSPADSGQIQEDTISDTPEESIERALSQLNDQLASEILSALHQASASFFERVVVELLVGMGYGGSKKEAAEVVGKAGDGGIHGIIKEDRLGLDAVYIQAKRWDGVVGWPEIQKFVGALQRNDAQKGIFITTSWYTPEGIEYAKRIQNKVVLIDGKQLADLMIEHGIGTTTIGTYSVKRLDSDYFSEE